jgi:hypothetical protein
MAVQEVYLFLSVIVQMGCDQRDRLKDYGFTLLVFVIVFYRNSAKQDRFFYMLRVLHFFTVELNMIRQMKIMTKKHKNVMIIYKLYDPMGRTYMSVYLDKDRKHATAIMTTTSAAVSGLTTKIENLGHKLYMDEFFSSSNLFDSLHMKAINCCCTVTPNQKGMSTDLD